jgi:hypothetical protein
MRLRQQSHRQLPFGMFMKSPPSTGSFWLTCAKANSDGPLDAGLIIQEFRKIQPNGAHSDT